jgi:hypothetical protein
VYEVLCCAASGSGDGALLWPRASAEVGQRIEGGQHAAGRELLGSGLDYTETGKRLGIPPGQVYLIATGMAADGADSERERLGRKIEAAAKKGQAS